MTDTQHDAIRDAMKSYTGTSFWMVSADATPDSLAYADKLRDALTGAGLVCANDSRNSHWSIAIDPGVSIYYSTGGKKIVDKLVEVLNTSGALKETPTFHEKEGTSTMIQIFVTPNR